MVANLGVPDQSDDLRDGLQLIGACYKRSALAAQSPLQQQIDRADGL